MINIDRIKARKVKVCPVVLRSARGRLQLLVFRHPQAGVQIVKGSLEEGEKIEETAVRELYEESGIGRVQACRYLARWDSPYDEQVWHFVRCDVGDLPDTWTHFTEDGGGHLFEFFWHPLDAPPTDEWYAVFKAALREIRKCV